MSTQTLMTVEQFAQMHITETERFELVEGRLIPLSSGIPLHGKVRDLVLYFLLGYFRNKPIGDVIAEIDCRLGPNTVRRADVSVFLGDRVIILSAKPASIVADIPIGLPRPRDPLGHEFTALRARCVRLMQEVHAKGAGAAT